MTFKKPNPRFTAKVRESLKKIIREEYRKVLKEASGLDDAAIDELELFGINDRKSYDTLHKVFVPVLLKFKKKGTFDKVKAMKLFDNYYQQVRQNYKAEFGDDIKLNPAERREFGERFLKNLEKEGYLDI